MKKLMIIGALTLGLSALNAIAQRGTQQSPPDRGTKPETSEEERDAQLRDAPRPPRGEVNPADRGDEAPGRPWMRGPNARRGDLAQRPPRIRGEGPGRQFDTPRPGLGQRGQAAGLCPYCQRPLGPMVRQGRIGAGQGPGRGPAWGAPGLRDDRQLPLPRRGGYGIMRRGQGAPEGGIAPGRPRFQQDDPRPRLGPPALRDGRQLPPLPREDLRPLRRGFDGPARPYARPDREGISPRRGPLPEERPALDPEEQL